MTRTDRGWACTSLGALPASLRLEPTVDGRQSNPEDGAPGLRPHRDASTVPLLDGLAREWQAEARALADALGREVGLEQARHDVGRDAGAGVGHLHGHLPLAGARAQGEGPLPLHGVERV